MMDGMSRDRSGLAVLAEIEVSAVRVNTLVPSSNDVSVAAVADLKKEKGGGDQTRVDDGKETKRREGTNNSSMVSLGRSLNGLVGKEGKGDVRIQLKSSGERGEKESDSPCSRWESRS